MPHLPKLLLAGCLLLSPAAFAANRPNVLVILTDDQRWDALGIVQRELGDGALFPWFQTPNLDRLAAEGARFANVFVTTSLCSPSRASFLSGRYARAHKVLNNFTEYPNDLPGYPSRLHEAGYETAYIGKWHMGEDNDEQRPGFDFWMSHRGQGNYFNNTFNVNGTRKEFPGYYTSVITDAAVDWLGKPRSLRGQAVQVRRLKPGKQGALPLLALHYAERVPALVVGQDDENVGRVGRQGGRRPEEPAGRKEVVQGWHGPNLILRTRVWQG